MTLSGQASATIKRLSHVSLGTPDLGRAVGFYRDVLGCSVAHEFRNETGEMYGAFMHSGDGTFIELFYDAELAYTHQSRFRHFCFECEDLQFTASRLRLMGFSPELKRGRTDGVLQTFIEDPDGNVVELQQHDEQSALLRFIP